MEYIVNINPTNIATKTLYKNISKKSLINECQKLSPFNFSFNALNMDDNPKPIKTIIKEKILLNIMDKTIDNSKNKYLLADNKKFNRADFYIYYDLFNFDTLITDNTIDEEVLAHYKQYVQIEKV